MGIEGKLLVSRKNIVVNKESIGIDKDLTKDRNMDTFKTYCKRRKSGARFPDRKAKNGLCACHCIAGNECCLLRDRSAMTHKELSRKESDGPLFHAVDSVVATENASNPS